MSINRRQLTVSMAALAASLAFAPQMGLAQEGPIRIGVITSLSGFAQVYGEANQIGTQIAADRINAAGGVNGRPIEIVLRDDQGLPDGTVAAYRDLAGTGIRHFISGPISGTVVALGPLFKDTDHIMIGAGPNNLSITHENYNDNIFRLQLTSIPVFTGLGVVLAEKAPEVTNWISISSDQQANIDLTNVLEDALKAAHAEAGREITIQDMVLTKAGAGDFRAQIAQIARSGSTGIINSLVGSDSLTFYTQAKAFGLDRNVQVFADVSANLNSMTTISDAIPASVWTPYYWYAQDDGNPVSQELYAAAVERTGTEYPFGFIALAHDAVVALADAMSRAESDDTAAVIAALESGSPMGAAGPIVFREEDHTYTGEMTFLQFGADAEAEGGLSVKEVVRFDSVPYMEPATPGERFVIE